MQNDIIQTLRALPRTGELTLDIAAALSATTLDKIIFATDKLAWVPMHAPFRADMQAALPDSLDKACWIFLVWSLQQNYSVVHPWLRQAYQEISDTLETIPSKVDMLHP